MLCLIFTMGVSVFYLNGFIWLKKGYEEIKINKISQLIEVYRVGLFVLDKQKATLRDSTFELRKKTSRISNPYSEDSLVYGLGPGKILIRSGKKVYEFGVSINEIQADELISEINDFLGFP